MFRLDHTLLQKERHNLTILWRWPWWWWCMHSLVSLLKVLFEATPEAWAPLGHIIHIITSDTRRNLKKASLCQKPQNSLFFVFLVDTLLIICFASCGSNVCDDPLPPAPPPPFVVLDRVILCANNGHTPFGVLSDLWYLVLLLHVHSSLLSSSSYPLVVLQTTKSI